ncbi:hypothetical protein GUJ93_ZPchr0007g6148 [Zizania palustris]|uniref:Late embryogenesis abundant protein LEA-2 subgroup domain-containing protein n=1 Tax=Zizania palustris TaxID=103762 RepID=A0A8J5W5E0_ZIZPA|nr:hypothetical protein GUJ93_ZPchr0007g6148 [Zizania palustris]
MCDDCCICSDDWRYYLICFAAVSVLVLVAVLVAAYCFVRHPVFIVEEASLTRFSLSSPSSATALAYNLSLALTIHNPNWAMSIKNVKPMEAAYRFDDQQFDRVLIADKAASSVPMKTVVYRVVSGSDNAYASLGNAGVVEYGKERKKGTFQVDVVVTGQVSYTARYTKCKIEATCPLELQLAPPGQAPAAVAFQKVKCTLAKPKKYC